MDDIIALGRCPECGTTAGLWHKLGCSLDRLSEDEEPEALQAAIEAAIHDG
jgi:hypothetical protein